jgi:2-dehydro-3-deoxygalactonokinase
MPLGCAPKKGEESVSSSIFALDWGTSNLRAFRLGADGTCHDQRAAAKGILAVPPGGFEAALTDIIGDWLTEAPDAPVILSGMVGSRQGWVEVPYAEAPAGIDALLAKALPKTLKDGRTALFLPGVSCLRDGVPDVMRGEETQIIGALALAGLADGPVCAPGTHSKWVQVAGGRIVSFATYMTGELFALLRDHSLLGRGLVRNDAGQVQAAPPDLARAGFERGVAQAFADPAVLRTLFSTRTLGLFDKIPALALADYLSGLLIGAEVAAALPEGGRGTVPVIASAALADRYAWALALRGYTAQPISGDAAAVAGLAHFATAYLSQGR